MKFPRFNIKKKNKVASPTSEAENALTPVSNHDFMPRDAENTATEALADDVTDFKKEKSVEKSTEKVAQKPVEESVEEPDEAKSTPILSEKISISAIFSCIWRNKRKYILPLLLTAAFASWIALSIPRYYKVTVMLAPEYNLPSSGLSSMVGNLAGSLGMSMGGMSASTDAIVPLFYPDLIGSTDFLVPLFNVQVTTKDGKFKGRYADYLAKHQKHTWWNEEINKLKNRISPPPKSATRGVAEPINPFALTFTEDALMQAIKASINCSVDKKTDVITLTATAQDPLVAALIADTVRVRLQDFIIQYRTVKARHDLEYIRSLCEKAHKEYVKKQHAYATFVDANQDLVLATFKAKEKDLEDEMQLAFNAYSLLQTRVQHAEAKVQERMPAFTTLQNASVPVKHAGPKRVIMVLALLVLAFIVTTVVVVSRDKQVRW